MNLPLAQSSLSFLIYLIVGAFWLAGNLLQQKKAKQKAEEMRRKREAREAEERRTGKKVQSRETKIESELEAFLGRLSGESAPAPTPRPRPQTPVQSRPQTPPPLQRRVVQNDEIRFDGPVPSTLKSKATVPPPPPVSKPAFKPATPPVKESTIGEMDMEKSFKQISEMKEAVELVEGDLQHSLQQEALINVRSMMIDLSSSSTSVPLIPMQSMRAVHTRTPHPDLQNRRTFKQALVASVVLGPPKALQANPFKETP